MKAAMLSAAIIVIAMLLIGFTVAVMLLANFPLRRIEARRKLIF